MTKEKFYSKVLGSDRNGCHIWGGVRTPQGYGRVHLTKGKVLAHRLVYELFIGPIENKQVLHKCDVTSCVNPTHLYLGDNTQNIADKINRGRHQYANKTECKNGHPLEPYQKWKRRFCRICMADADKRFKQRIREAKLAEKNCEN